MKSVGEVLEQARKKRGLSKAEVSKQTKIQLAYINAIEESKYESLPSATFVKGFIQNYAKAVGVKPKSALAIFRRDFIEGPEGGIVPRGLMEPIESPKVFNPKTTMVVVFSVLAMLILGFFARQIYLFYSAPSLELTSPQEAAEVVSPVSIAGVTSPDSKVEVGGKSLAVDEKGEFKTEIQLSEGNHTIVVLAVDRNGKENRVQRTVTVVER